MSRRCPYLRQCSATNKCTNLILFALVRHPQHMLQSIEVNFKRRDIVYHILKFIRQTLIREDLTHVHCQHGSYSQQYCIGHNRSSSVETSPQCLGSQESVSKCHFVLKWIHSSSQDPSCSRHRDCRFEQHTILKHQGDNGKKDISPACDGRR